MSRSSPELQPRLRFPDDSDAAFGPGKAELIRLIASTGSIRAASAQMGMSYNRAWTLVRDMNQLFREPLIVSVRGGETGGGAQVTACGQAVLERYTRMERSCRQATRADWAALSRLLR